MNWSALPIVINAMSHTITESSFAGCVVFAGLLVWGAVQVGRGRRWVGGGRRG